MRGYVCGTIYVCYNYWVDQWQDWSIETFLQIRRPSKSPFSLEHAFDQDIVVYHRMKSHCKESQAFEEKKMRKDGSKVDERNI